MNIVVVGIEDKVVVATFHHTRKDKSLDAFFHEELRQRLGRFYVVFVETLLHKSLACRRGFQLFQPHNMSQLHVDDEDDAGILSVLMSAAPPSRFLRSVVSLPVPESVVERKIARVPFATCEDLWGFYLVRLRWPSASGTGEGRRSADRELRRRGSDHRRSSRCTAQHCGIARQRHAAA